MSGSLDSFDPRESYFDAAQALYWYAADYHSGQSSELYSILSTMGYSPASTEYGPEADSVAALIYAELESGELEPREVQEWYLAGYNASDPTRERK